MGNDVGYGNGGNGASLATRGRDALFSGSGNGRSAGGNDATGSSVAPRDDKARGRHGDDLLDGDDDLIFPEGQDTVRIGGGDKTLRGGSSKDTVHGGDGRDALDGGRHDDVLPSAEGLATLTGGRGDDVFRARAAEDAPVQRPPSQPVCATAADTGCIRRGIRCTPAHSVRRFREDVGR